MIRIVLTIICCFLLNTAFARNIVWDGTSKMLNIADKLQVLEDPEGSYNFDQVSSASFRDQFKPSTKVNLNFGYTNSIFWLRFSLDNRSGASPMLELVQACLPVCDLYYYDSGRIVFIKAGYKVPLNEKLVKNHFQVYPLPQGQHEFYVRLFSNSGPIPVRIYEQSAYESKSNNQKLVYGWYLGFMFFLVLSNLFFGFSLRNKMYLFYSFNVIIYTCYSVAVVDGFLPYLFPRADLIFWYITIPTIGIIAQNLYAVTFLELRKWLPGLNRFIWYMIGYFTVYAIIKFWLPFPIVLAWNTVNALLSFFMIGYMGLRVGKAGNKMGYYFAWAFFIYFALVLCEASYIQTGYPAYFWELSHTAISTITEAFILSFLLSKRFEWEKEEFEKKNSDSQRKLLEKTIENERIVREQNVLLERKVDERTYQLKESLKDVEAERQKSENLIHNILPEEIAEELKQNGSSEAKLYEQVSVLFTDFVNFTGISEKISPKELVDEINFCYKAFDEIVECHGLEKIKTIGDAYLAVCGLPVADPMHAENLVNAALEILEFVRIRRAQGGLFEIRAGASSGPLVAGIVGNKKFAYDIWGDTVNTANRMESNSEAGRLNISHATHALIKQKYDCHYRGKLEVKNKGNVDMYFVNGRMGEEN